VAHGAILLVDDEPSLVRLLDKFLTQRGFEVDACTGSAEALDKFAAAPERYRLLIADVNMPGVPGDELAVRIAGLSDSVLILLTSGLPYNTGKFPEGVRARAAFLQKPFLPRMIIDAVDNLFNR